MFHEPHYVILHNVPVVLDKLEREPIGTRCFVIPAIPYGPLYLLELESITNGVETDKVFVDIFNSGIVFLLHKQSELHAQHPSKSHKLLQALHKLFILNDNTLLYDKDLGIRKNQNMQNLIFSSSWPFIVDYIENIISRFLEKKTLGTRDLAQPVRCNPSDLYCNSPLWCPETQVTTVVSGRGPPYLDGEQEMPQLQC
ncbi:hypothetical protein LXL04_038307 [Taraxacum kok-saghyz]